MKDLALLERQYREDPTIDRVMEISRNYSKTQQVPTCFDRLDLIVEALRQEPERDELRELFTAVQGVEWPSKYLKAVATYWRENGEEDHEGRYYDSESGLPCLLEKNLGFTSKTLFLLPRRTYVVNRGLNEAIGITLKPVYMSGLLFSQHFPQLDMPSDVDVVNKEVAEKTVEKLGMRLPYVVELGHLFANSKGGRDHKCRVSYGIGTGQTNMPEWVQDNIPEEGINLRKSKFTKDIELDCVTLGHLARMRLVLDPIGYKPNIHSLEIESEMPKVPRFIEELEDPVEVKSFKLPGEE